MGNLWAIYALFITMLFVIALIYSFYIYIVKPHVIKKTKDNHNDFSPKIKFLLLIVVLLVIIGFWMPFVFTRHSIIKEFDFTTTGQIGDTFGGIINPFIALAAVIITGLAFYAQYQANKQVQDQFKLQQFESQFYKLLDFHRENISDMEFELDGEKAIGRKSFKLIIKQIENAYYEILPFLHANKDIKDLVNEEYLLIINNLKDKRNHIDLIKFIALDISYTVSFIGISQRDQYPLTRILLKKYNKQLIKNIFHCIKLKPVDLDLRRKWNIVYRASLTMEAYDEKIKEWDKTLLDEEHMEHIYYESQMNLGEENDYLILIYDSLKGRVKYYGGHQFRLGHYFRNLFQIFKQIDSNIYLTDEEKKNYAKIIRSQLSSYELYLLFFNSISFLGREWELSHIHDEEKWIITKYEILKNIPDVNIYNNINIPDYYPDINFDFK